MSVTRVKASFRLCYNDPRRRSAIIRRITADIYEISLAWSNAYLLTDGSEAALIDTGLRQDRAKLLGAMESVGIRPGQLRAIYLTHGHCDHAGNMAFLAQQAGGDNSSAQRRPLVYAHRDEARYLGLPQRNYAPRGVQCLLRPHTTLALTLVESLYPVTRRNVDVSVSDGDILDAPGGALRVVGCPGHTRGHIAFFREHDGILFSGDAIMNIVPVKRVVGLHLPIAMFSEDMAMAKRSARLLADLEPRTLLSGHGWPMQEETARQLKAWTATLD